MPRGERQIVDRPPRFRESEIVRVVRAAPGRYGGRYYVPEAGGFVEPDVLVGREGVVWNAHPAGDHSGWRIGIEIVVRRGGAAVALTDSSGGALSDQSEPAEDTFLSLPELPEEALESTGFVEQWGDEGEASRRLVPVDRAAGGAWRDHLDLVLITDFLPRDWDEQEAFRHWEAVDAIAESAAVAIGRLVPLAEDVRWETAAVRDSLAVTNFRVYPRGAVLAAYARVTASPQKSWLHDEDEEGWLVSRWRRPGSATAAFLAAGISEAQIACKSYASPSRMIRL